MCGIAGILNQGGAVSADALILLQSLLKHRGPDAQNSFISKDKQLGLVHTRLSIQDLTYRASQPMATQDGRYTIVFNGEIYNFKTLRKQLETRGEKFLSDSDTEVILKLYQQKKEKCLSDLEGMFAFAIWDEVAQECFLARDPMGIKPLYYANNMDSFTFSSECQAIQKTFDKGLYLNTPAIESFLKKGSVPEPLSIDTRIRMLPTGHYAFWRKGELEISQYDSLRLPTAFLVADREAAVSTTRTALLESLQKHFVSDVEVGVFLSGGLDSTALIALSRELGYSKFSTYTVGFKNQPDETILARRTATHFGTKHHEILMDAKSADTILDGYLAATDQPTIDGFNVYVISKFAHENGAKVVLSGLGGDELFGGYKTLRAVPRLFQIASNPAGKVALSFLSVFMKSIQKNSKWQRLQDLLREKELTIESVYAAYRGIFTANEASEILGILKIKNNSNQKSIYLNRKINLAWGLADQVDWLEWTVYLRDQLLRDADIFSMHFGLELRVPFVDSKLFNIITSIAPSIRLNQKQLLKAAVPEIPEWIQNQPKRGFLFPFSSWNILDKHFKNEQIKRLAWNYTDWYQKWALLQLDHLISKLA